MAYTHLDPGGEQWQALERAMHPHPMAEGEAWRPANEQVEQCNHCRRTVPYSLMELIGTELYCPDCAAMTDEDKAEEARIQRAEDRRDERG
jgi:hypothetical protein